MSGSHPPRTPDRAAETEGLVDIDGRRFYRMPNLGEMAPFLISVVSDGDRWMYVSSTGALTCGRRNQFQALFPYETDDRLHRAARQTGPATAIRASLEGEDRLWRPFADRAEHRCLLKAVTGDVVVFQETNPELALTFTYRWATSQEFGFIRSATLSSQSERPVEIELVDGLLNLLPWGLSPAIYRSMSNLTNAYKRSEVVRDTRLAVYSLEAAVSDSPEPTEVLRANTVWSVGLDDASISMSPETLARFESGQPVAPTPLLTGRPGAYLLHTRMRLEPDQSVTWHMVADTGLDQPSVADLERRISSQASLIDEVGASIDRGTASLVAIAALADGLQMTGDAVASAHHLVNTTYNVMRGGVPLNGYSIDRADFQRFVSTHNRNLARRQTDWLRSLPDRLPLGKLHALVAAAEDPHLSRLALEYLPFGFSRRHGDPSRPWNTFEIRVQDDRGAPILHFEGNWRDIFQNWEALAASFPEYLPGMIALFVNASTPDGFNPYRITRDGIEWEVQDPDDPWSNIGYWGDHQIVYLLRLLEAADRYIPGRIRGLLSESWFAYADVPYRIVPYDELVKDPRSSVLFDTEAHDRAQRRTAETGSDGKLLWTHDGEPHLVTLAEKLLVPALSKLSNFVPGGGIWMNTRRPEWNDANNALAGYGLSMVTVHHLRRYLDHLRKLLGGLSALEVSNEIIGWIRRTANAFRSYTATDDRTRRNLIDELGTAFSDYREQVYASGFSGTGTLPIEEVDALWQLVMPVLDATIRTSRRSDGLFDAYNLIHFEDEVATIEPLYAMLEGQVAALESGVIPPAEQADLLDALFASGLYRADQRSFMLYPVRDVPSFLDKNLIPRDAVLSSPLLAELVDAGDTSIITSGADGQYRFNPDLATREDLKQRLRKLGSPWHDLVLDHTADVEQTYEQVFRHHAYTGRSSSMYGYEGIGSIYWHMVAKLLVAVQRSILDAHTEATTQTMGRLVSSYRRIREGLGFNKTASEFGAIPIDPYSHTPRHAGAQQPGMTGLVKEELLTRPLETGVRVEDGSVVIDPVLLRKDELVAHRQPWVYLDVSMQERVISLPARSLGITLCQVPVVIQLGQGEPKLELTRADGTTETVQGSRLDRSVSAKIFSRSGTITRIVAHLPESSIPTDDS